MFRYLVDHAIKNVWCNNEQDNQLIIAGQRITNPDGVLNRFTLMNRHITLPTIGKFYHVFQIGQINPGILGLLSSKPEWTEEVWISFKEAMNSLKLIANIYVDQGIELPRFKTYYMFTKDKNLILAVEQNNKIPITFRSDQIYLRLYTNAYFQTYTSDAETNDYIYTNGKVVLNNSDILAIRNEYESYTTKVGFVYAYRNGLYVDRLDLVTIAVGDIVEFVFDSSVKRIVTFTVKDLNIFNSELDSKYKYLLHYLSESNNIIDYQDDIDIHILYVDQINRYKGCYYHRNSVDSIRMVTHKDYSLTVDYFNNIAIKLKSLINIESLDIRDFKIQLKIRKSGYNRPLIYDNNRIFELYKLTDDLIVQAMLGINSTVSEWRAEKLEASGYTQIMRETYNDIDIALVEKSYGYNSISKIVADTPSKTTLKNTLQTISLPYGLYENSTMYEYDSNGELLGYYIHSIGYDYECRNNNTRLVEALVGIGTNKPDVRFGFDNISLPTINSYRVYKCTMLGDNLVGNWSDITDSEFYTVENNTLKWTGLETDQYLMVRTDSSFLCYDLFLDHVAGTFYFTLSEIENRFGTDVNFNLPVPLGELDIFLNGRSLIRGLDYIVDFPKVYIVNKEYLLQPADSLSQWIHVRFTGFSDSQLQLDPIEDHGFIQHGFMSNNNRYDIRDDKVLRITMDGYTLHRDDVMFSEDHQGISVSNPLNGKPYQIKDIVVPLRNLTDEDTYSLRDKSIAIDEKISGYLTTKIPEPIRNANSAIFAKYILISPFFTHLIYDLKNNLIDVNLLIPVLSDNDVINICSIYEPILKFDPINPDNYIDFDYVTIHPHDLYTTIDLDIYKYRFLLRVVKLYGNGLIELSPFVTFSN